MTTNAVCSSSRRAPLASRFRVLKLLTPLIVLLSILCVVQADESSAPFPGAIFVTQADGTIPNVGIGFSSNSALYLHTGAPIKSPLGSPGTPKGLYVFQVTDASSNTLLSDDPAKCRVVNVSDHGYITSLVDPTTLDPPLKSTWLSNGTIVPCHVYDVSANQPSLANRHDTNPSKLQDTDAISVQLMPFLPLPTNARTYKAWIVPLSAYLVKGGKLDQVPIRRFSTNKTLTTQEAADPEQQLGYLSDPGFAAPYDQMKTDSFLITSQTTHQLPTFVHITAFNDLNDNAVFDDGDRPIKCVMADGKIDHECSPLSGGWSIAVTDPLGITNVYSIPGLVPVDPPGNYTFQNLELPGWMPVVTIVDSESKGLVDPLTLSLEDQQPRSVQFGHKRTPVSIHGHAYFDVNKNGISEPNETPLRGVLVCLVTPNMQPVLFDASNKPIPGIDKWGCQFSDAAGFVWWRNLKQGNYKIIENMDLSLIKGLAPTSAVEFDAALYGTDDFSVSFGAVGECQGLTPEYWANWRALYAPAEFAMLLQETRARNPQAENSLRLADTILENATTAHQQSDFHQLRAFMLANQLTLSLTQHPSLRNPQDASLFNGCLLPGRESNGTLDVNLALAEGVIDALGDEDRSNHPSNADIQAVKDALTRFCYLQPEKNIKNTDDAYYDRETAEALLKTVNFGTQTSQSSVVLILGIAMGFFLTLAAIGAIVKNGGAWVRALKRQFVEDDEVLDAHAPVECLLSVHTSSD